MAVEFRCPKCQKLVRMVTNVAAEVVCPRCGTTVVVPGSAEPAHPYLAMDQAAVTPSTAGSGDLLDHGPPAHAGAHDGGNEEIFALLAKIMPWAISICLHIIVVLGMLLLAMIVMRKSTAEQTTIPEAFLSPSPGGVMAPARRNSKLHIRRPTSVDRAVNSPRETAAIDVGRTTNRIELISTGGGGEKFGGIPLQAGGETSVRSSFYGSGGNAHHIVYVVDRSGSMVDSFDSVRVEILRSVSRLRPAQDFHVILFSGGPPTENPPKRLVKATYANKERLAEFLSDINPGGPTDPVPALIRAFQVLDKADQRPGKLIYLLTDGEFHDNNKVVEAINQVNHARRVAVNTYLYGYRPPKAVEVMKRIAEDNGGTYRYVPAEQ